MTISGKIRRGKKWYIQRDIENRYPDYIEKDNHKKEEIEFYLFFKEHPELEKELKDKIIEMKSENVEMKANTVDLLYQELIRKVNEPEPTTKEIKESIKKVNNFDPNEKGIWDETKRSKK